MTVKVCDAIMGSGKTEASITYMNENKDKRFIYITPYLDEAARIKRGCPDLHFVEPSAKISQYKFSKSVHTAALIEEQRNIATTHQAFKSYTKETLNMIKEYEYTLIIDENVDTLEKFNIHPGDMDMVIDAGYVEENDGHYKLACDRYSGTTFSELFRLLRSRELLRIEQDEKSDDLFFWSLPPDLILSFHDVFVLTYLFGGQSLCHFFEMNNIQYEYIGISHEAGGDYRFCPHPDYIPPYVSFLERKIHIYEGDNLNMVGTGTHDLSMNWYKKSSSDVKQLKDNVYNYFRHICSDVPTNSKMWGTYSKCRNHVKSKGYSRGFVVFNSKATNQYRDRSVLAYCSNVFMNAGEKSFYIKNGVDPQEDVYALSIMLQWIWRSAIRDGKEIWIYIPSARMRTLLKNWIETTEKEYIHIKENQI